MARFEIAHINQQGQDMIIVPLDRQFEFKSSADQSAFVDAFQYACMEAGLAGTVVPVWPSGRGMKFIAPQPWHPFFKSISLQWVGANINRWIEV